MLYEVVIPWVSAVTFIPILMCFYKRVTSAGFKLLISLGLAIDIMVAFGSLGDVIYFFKILITKGVVL